LKIEREVDGYWLEGAVGAKSLAGSVEGAMLLYS